MQSTFDSQDKYEERGRRQVMQGNDDLMGQTMARAPRKRLLDGISIAQVIAASAAAATSMLLASKIGIAGSVIGAAVSSMVTVICSQLYRNALDASAQKLRLRQTAIERPRTDLAGESRRHTQEDPHQRDHLAGNPYVMDPYGNNPYDDDPYAYGDPYNERAAYSGSRIAPTKLRARAAAQRNASARKIALVSAGVAVLAVIACVAVVLALTAGNGLGAKPASIFTTAAPQDERVTAGSPGDIESSEPPTTPSSPSTDTDTGDGDASDTPETGTDPSSPSDPDQGTSGDSGNTDGTTGGSDGTSENSMAKPSGDTTDKTSPSASPAIYAPSKTPVHQPSTNKAVGTASSR